MTIDLPYGKFSLRPGDCLNAQTLTDGFWDLDLKPFFDRVPAGAICLDVGAHVGLYAGYLASKGCSVIAMEGHPAYLGLLTDNVDQNVKAWPGGVWIEPRFAYSRVCRLQELKQHDTPASNTWLPMEHHSDAGGYLAIPLDDLLGFLNTVVNETRPLGLLKVDVQGADLHVLNGAERLIQAYHPPILIEYEAALAALHGHVGADYENWIRDHGYLKTPINGWNAYLTWKGEGAGAGSGVGAPQV